MRHKVGSAIIIVLVLGGGYYGYNRLTATTGETRYVTSPVQKGTLVVSIIGSGQVSASSQIDIKPKVSGEIVWVNAKTGDTVKAWQALIGIDNKEAKKTLLSAEQSLVTSKLQYQKDEAQAPIDYQKAIDVLASAKESLITFKK